MVHFPDFFQKVLKHLSLRVGLFSSFSFCMALVEQLEFDSW